MEGSPKIRLVRYREPKTTTERKFYAALSQLNVKGDSISDPPSLHDARFRIESELEILHNDANFKKSNRWRLNYDPTRVWVTVSPTVSISDDIPMIGFERITLEERLEEEDEDDADLDSLDKTAFSYGSYNFNENGVCLNPDIPHSYRSKAISWEISIARTADGYVFGCDANRLGADVGCGGWSCGANTDSDFYQSKPEAIAAAAKGILDYLSASHIKPFPKKELDGLKKIIADHQETVIPDLAKLFSKDAHRKPQTIKHKKATMSSDLKKVPIFSIGLSSTNCLHREKWEMEEPALKELTESIKAKGVIQPILIRPNEGAGDHEYILVCGERRYKASMLAGCEEIPAVIREISEEEAFDLQITENLQRQDVHPLKEAQAFKALMEANPEKNTIAELSHRFGKSPEYIAQRLSFNNLIDEMKKDFRAGKMLIGHAIQFSRLQEADQRECLAGCKVKYGPNEGSYESVKVVVDFIEQKVIREIKKAPFNPNDPELVPAAGSCVDCPHRTGKNPELFADVKDKDRCFKPECFALKTSTYLIQKIDTMREDNPNMAVIADHSVAPDPKVKKHLQKNGMKVLKSFMEYQDASKSDKGAIKALVVAGGEIGETKWIKLTEKAKEDAAVSSVKGSVAKNTPEHFDELIAQEKAKLEQAKKQAQESVLQKLIERVKDLKPFQEPDPTPLNPYELALFYYISEPAGFHNKKVDALYKSLSSDKGLNKNQNKIEALAKNPQDLINFIVRAVIADHWGLDDPDAEGYGFIKAYEGWKGANYAELQEQAKAEISAAEAAFKAKKDEYSKKKAELAPKKSAAPKPEKTK